MITIYLICLQWQMIAKNIGAPVSFRSIFHINMVGTFWESVTPAAKAGGEAAKIVLLRSHAGYSTSQSIALVGLQKTYSMIAFLLLSLFSLFWFLLRYEASQVQKSILLISFVFLVLAVALLTIMLVKPMVFNRLIMRLPLKPATKEKIHAGAGVLESNIRAASTNLSTTFVQMALSIFIWLFFAVKSYILALALHIDIDFLAISAITYLVYMIAMVPLTPGGLGTFEGSMALLLLPLNISFNQSLLLAIVIRFVTFWFVFLVSLVYLGIYQLVKIFRKQSSPTM